MSMEAKIYAEYLFKVAVQISMKLLKKLRPLYISWYNLLVLVRFWVADLVRSDLKLEYQNS